MFNLFEDLLKSNIAIFTFPRAFWPTLINIEATNLECKLGWVNIGQCLVKAYTVGSLLAQLGLLFWEHIAFCTDLPEIKCRSQQIPHRSKDWVPINHRHDGENNDMYA